MHGKALANGFPLAAVGGRAEVHGWGLPHLDLLHPRHRVRLPRRGQDTLDVMVAATGCREHLRRVGRRLLDRVCMRFSRSIPIWSAGVGGIPEMCFLQYADEAASRAVTAACAQAGLLFKRSAYNFVSLAHDRTSVDRLAGCLGRGPLRGGKTCLDWEIEPDCPRIGADRQQVCCQSRRMSCHPGSRP